MKIKSIFFLTAAVLVLLTSYMSYSNENDDNKEEKELVNVCFNYRFYPGDTILYQCVSYDSIIVDYGPYLWKNRYEIYTVTCDSINDKGHYIMSINLDKYQVKEIDKEKGELSYSNSPWLNRHVWIEMDSLGKRYSYGYRSELKPGVAPGGSFQPPLLIPLQRACYNEKESFTFTELIESPENGLPIPLSRNSYLIRPLGLIDTLGYKCRYLDYIYTGQGSNQLNPKHGMTKVTSILNGHGFMYLSTEYRIPVYHFITVEQKLTFHGAANEEKNGRHFINSSFVLLDFKPSKLRK